MWTNVATRIDARSLRRPSPAWGTGLLALAAVGLVGAAQGGYFETAWGWITLGLLLTAALAVAFRPSVDLAPVEAAFLGGFGLVIAWIAVSAAWSVSAPSTVLDLERALIYVAALAAFFALPARSQLRPFACGLLVAVVVIAVWALVQRLGGDDGGALSGPIGYWNGLGLLAALGILLALGLVAEPGRPAVGFAAAACLVPLGITLALTSSRGAVIALAAAMVVGLAVHPRLAGRPRRVGAVVLAAVVAVAFVAALVHDGGPRGLGERLRDAVAAPVAARGVGNASLLSASANGRSDYWRAAWDESREHPWLGSGAGTFEVFWNRDRPTIYGARDAHSLYLETLAELGPLGLLLLAGTLAVPLVAFRSARREPLAAAVLAAYVAFLVHAAVDWDWELPVVTLAGLLCGAGLVAAAGAGRRRPLPAWTRWVALGGAGVLAAFALVGHVGNVAIDGSVDAAARGDFPAAERSADRAVRWNPWSAEARRLQGEAQLAQGHAAVARRSFRAGLARDEHSWRLWYDLALASRGSARADALAEALRLNRYSAEARALAGLGASDTIPRPGD